MQRDKCLKFCDSAENPKIPPEVNCHVREKVATVSRGLHEHTLCAYAPCIYDFTHW